MKKTLPIKAQYNIINEVESKYLKFLDPSFDSSCFLKCRDNFALNSHIESKKIFEAKNPKRSIYVFIGGCTTDSRFVNLKIFC